MQNSMMKDWLDSSHLYGANIAYVEDLYEVYLEDPESIPEDWAEVFNALPRLKNVPQEIPLSPLKEYFKHLAKDSSRFNSVAQDPLTGAKQVKVLQLINAFRFRGHQHANLDPLELWKQPRVPDLDPAFHSLDEADFSQSFNVGSYAIGKETMQLDELYRSLQKTYCGSIGAEYMHITDTEEKRWIQAHLESVEGCGTYTTDDKVRLLKSLTAAEGLEKYLGAKFPGAKRFSLEGGDSLIVLLKEMIRSSGLSGIKEVVIGMAHRGRLNVLVNVLGKTSAELFDEFAGRHDGSWGTGDVKYHQGFSSDFATPAGNIHLSLAFNPSHLEIVNPVVMGSVRARQDRRGEQCLPVTIHGDSAIAGQGVVQETFNMSQTRGYSVGGTVRVVINNQIGFTTSNPRDSRSTQYCTDIAKMVQAPIFHVNGDDPEAVAFVSQLALDFRNTFKRDVVIELICYRRHGHNEADEPNATQPLMYQKIKKHPTPRKVYAEQLIGEGSLTDSQVISLANGYRDQLDRGECVVEEWRPMTGHSVNWKLYLNHSWNIEYDTRMDLEHLKELAAKVAHYPINHTLHPRVRKVYEDRELMARGEKPADWGFAENLAYATLLDIGAGIRLTGQDSGRGTFFHRHAVLHSQDDGSVYMPLKHISDKQGMLSLYDSVLSEEAVLAFEYGYSTAQPESLVLWEAQFGDFANGAQVVIDQFLSSGEQKWGRMCGLVMLLPHGYEGQGPEHSSARLERYLQLCAEENMQVCVPSTPAQVYHMLRRQHIRRVRRPLIVMSPKSLLRHPLAVSSLEELANGRFYNVLGEIDDINPEEVEQVVMCSGKVYYDLLDARRKAQQNNVAIIRIEQLYPFPYEEIQEVLAPLQHVKQFIWCQEEPLNQGAWYSSQHHFLAAIPKGASLSYAGRRASASPAVGYMSLHLEQQRELVNDALTIKTNQ